MKYCRFALAVLLSISAGGANQESLDFITGHTDFRNARSMLREHVRQRAFAQLAARPDTVAKISSAADIAERKRYIRERRDVPCARLGGSPGQTVGEARPPLKDATL